MAFSKDNCRCPQARMHLIGSTDLLAPCSSGGHSLGRACTISEPDLTLSITSATPTVGPVLSLNGSVIAESDGEIGIVATGFLTCSGSSPTPAGGISPDDCFNPTNTLAFNFGGGRLTATTLVSPVAVDAGQQIQVSVNIRFE